MSIQSVSKAGAERTPADWLLGSLGIGGALVSAAFATYMIAVGPGAPDPHGSGYFTVFTHFDRRPQFAALREEKGIPFADAVVRGRRAPEVEQVVTTAATTAPPVDYTPTGSVASKAPAKPPVAPAPPGVAPPPVAADLWPARTFSLDGFVLRDVFDGHALVEGRHKLNIVSPGTVLDGAGEVLSIEKRRDAWVVVTQDGVIAARALR